MSKFPSILEEKTKELYDKLPRNMSETQIAEATGLTSNWISQFVNNKSTFPYTGRVEALYKYCNNNKPLEL